MDTLKNDFRYYKEIDSPFPVFNKLQLELAQEINEAFYPADGEEILSIVAGNNLMFVNNGFVLFGLFHFYIADNDLKLNVLKEIGKREMFLLNIALKEETQNTMRICVERYMNMLISNNTVVDASYKEIKRIISDVNNIKNSEQSCVDVSINLEKIVSPLIIEMLKTDYLVLKISNVTNTTFTYSILNPNNMEIMKSDKLPFNTITQFVENLYFKGEF